MATLQSVTILQRSGYNNEDGKFRSATYQVIFSGVPDTIAEILTADDMTTAIPVVGDDHPEDSTIKCRKVGPAKMDEDSREVYEVEVEFDDRSDDDGSDPTTGTKDPDPLNRPAEINFGYEVTDRPVVKDRDGNAVQNAAGDEFDPPLIEQDYRLLCIIERNVASISPSDLVTYQNRVNDATVTIAGVTALAGAALIRNYTAAAEYENGTAYVRERVEVLFANSHDREVANRGREYIDASDSNARKKFRTNEGEPAADPQWLTAAGDDGAGTPHYLTFGTKLEASFGPLSLPINFPDT